MEILIETFLLLIFLVLKGFFSGSEIAMVNCDKLKMRHQAKMGHRGARMVLRMFENPDVILGTTLMGTNIATVTLSTLGTLMFIQALGSSTGDLVAVLVFTPFLLVLGEIVPKSIFQQKADEIAPIIVYGLRFFSQLFFPLIFVFSRAARQATRLLGGSMEQSGSFVTREEIRMLLDMTESSSTRGRRFDRARVRRIIRFADTTVGEAMIPLPEVVGIRKGASVREAMDTVWRTGFNRLPVYEGNLTNVVGVATLNTWDLLDLQVAQRTLEDFVKAPLYISTKQTIDQTLPLLQARPADHMAVVVDEFGATIGILTMEDVFEEVVGEIDVGYDFDEYKPKRRFVFAQAGENEYLVDGRTPLSQINDELHIRLPVGDAHTVAGLILNRLRSIPKEGAYIVEQDHRFTVRQADARAIRKVHIERI
ncbi:MAG: HlyC/CorC family transporter [Magnetococcales bacterium]|nr:HlyC/CorC family transporter [Magnetococcales bacterium]